MTKFVAELFQRDVKNIRDEIYDKYVYTGMDTSNLVKINTEMYSLLKKQIEYYIGESLFTNGTDTTGLDVIATFIGTNSIDLEIYFPSWLVREFNDAISS